MEIIPISRIQLYLSYYITALKVADVSLISPRSFSRPHFYLSSCGGWLEAQMWFLYHPNASGMIEYGITYEILLVHWKSY